MQVLASEMDASDASKALLLASNDSVLTEKQHFDMPDQLVFDTNALLSKMGFGDRAFANAADLVASVSSMSVALYEKLFQFRLRGVERVPRTRQDYEHNAQLVADALRSALLDQSNGENAQDELTGMRLCAGDLGSIRRLLGMLEQVYTLLFEESLEVGERLRDVSLASVGEASVTNEVLGSSRRRVPPKFVKKQREESRSSDSGVGLSKSDDMERTSLRKSCTVKRNVPRSKVSEKQEEVRDGRAVSGKNELRSRSKTASGNKSQLDASFDPIAANTKKRSRLLQQSIKTGGNRTKLVAKETAGRRTGRMGSRVAVKSAATSGRKKQTKNEDELLKTKAYGRFVAVESGASSDEGKRRGSKNQHTEGKQGGFFEGVSSVQNNSDESMHFMEDEGAFAHYFSSISIEDARSEQEKNAKAAGRDVDDRENAQPNESTSAEKCMTHPKSTNQKESEEHDESTSSPVKKKVARKEPRAPERLTAAHVFRRDKTKSLYPLLPKTKRHASTSAAQAQCLRYKLSLKNHLQELRQREATQRRHLERAYKAGEHMANVDKIRSRRFEQDVRLHRIAVGLEVKNEEEKQLRHAMNHLLDLEKERLREEHRTTSSVLKQIQKEHAEREEAMENFYQNQIQIVKEQTRREVKERELVEKAQRSASEKMMRELRHERENQLAALLQEKQHLEEARKFRHTSEIAQLLDRTDEYSTRRTDAFYTAAMKARERHNTKKQQNPQRRSLDPYRANAKPLQRSTRLSSSAIR